MNAIETATTAIPAAQPLPYRPLQFSDIMWGVFCGMWVFSITAGIAYGIIAALMRL